MRRSARRVLALDAATGLLAIGAGLIYWFIGPPEDGASPSTPVLPRPPRQGDIAATSNPTVPAPLAEAVRILFEQGFADPRGFEYRAVELAGEAEVLRGPASFPMTHAWVMPADRQDGPRHAVAWNGLVHPLTRIGPAADVEADVRTLCAPGAKKTKMRPADVPGHLLTASQLMPTPAKVVLLLRLGRDGLARALWRSGGAHDLQAITTGVPDGRGWYAELASACAQDLLERAGMAHSRGDDPLALASLRELGRIRPMLLEKAGDVKPVGVFDPWNRSAPPRRSGR